MDENAAAQANNASQKQEAEAQDGGQSGVVVHAQAPMAAAAQIANRSSAKTSATSAPEGGQGGLASATPGVDPKFFWKGSASSTSSPSLPKGRRLGSNLTIQTEFTQAKQARAPDPVPLSEGFSDFAVSKLGSAASAKQMEDDLYYTKEEREAYEQPRPKTGRFHDIKWKQGELLGYGAYGQVRTAWVLRWSQPWCWTLRRAAFGCFVLLLASSWIHLTSPLSFLCLCRFSWGSTRRAGS